MVMIIFAKKLRTAFHLLTMLRYNLSSNQLPISRRSHLQDSNNALGKMD